MQYVQDPRGVELVWVKAAHTFSISDVGANETEVSDGSLSTEAALPKYSNLYQNLPEEGWYTGKQAHSNGQW